MIRQKDIYFFIDCLYNNELIELKENEKMKTVEYISYLYINNILVLEHYQYETFEPCEFGGDGYQGFEQGHIIYHKHHKIIFENRNFVDIKLLDKIIFFNENDRKN